MTNILTTVLARLREPSTWLSIAVLLLYGQGHMDPGMLQEGASSLGMILAGLGAAMAERGGK